MTKYLAENNKPLVGAFASIPKWDDRLLLIVDRINRNLPLAVPFISGSYNHWVTIYGYDLDAKVIHVVNGDGATPFQKFDRMNSFQDLPTDVMGPALKLANENGIGGNVLVFMWEK